MDADARDRWSHTAHADRPLCSPVDDHRLDAFLGGLGLPTGGLAVDYGCGTGEVLRRLVAVTGGTGIGVDLSARMLGSAPPDDAVELVRADARGWRPPRTPDVAVCMGATHIFGGLDGAAAALAAVVDVGGTVVIGDGYWRTVPGPASLADFDMDPDELPSLAGLVAAVEAAGLTPLAVQPSSEEEWDAYEWSLIGSVERWAAANPDDPDRDAFVERTHLMRDTYLRWRRPSFGFALVGARKAA